MNGRRQLLQLFESAIEAARADRAVERSLRASDPGPGPYFVLGAGKAVCAMAEGARTVLGDRVHGGLVATKQGHAEPLDFVEVVEAGHPIPDARSVDAAERALAAARRLDRDVRPLVLVSGGASALWAAPVDGVTLDDLCCVTDLLLRSGVDIVGMNAVRKHLSRIQGGGLLRALTEAGSESPDALALVLSDVAGNHVDVIGSGPVAPDVSTFDDAWSVLEGAAILDAVPSSVRRHLERGRAGQVLETPKAGDRMFARAEHRVVASLETTLASLCASAEKQSLHVRSLGARLYGEARDEATALATETRAAAAQGVQLLVAGGEPVVHVRGSGRGGRAQELALAFALEIDGDEATIALVAGTDGTDGPTEAAGAVVDGGTVARARQAGLNARAELERNNAYEVLHATGDLLVTGPTRTNVNDLALVRIHPVRDHAET